VQSSPKYRVAGAPEKRHVDALLGAASTVLLRAAAAPNPLAKQVLLNVYNAAVQSLVTPGWLTADQAATLASLSAAI
jgi:hypothetical protein